MYVTEMKMPSAFVSLSADEMEYDGEGLISNLFRTLATACMVLVGVGIGVAFICPPLGAGIIAFGVGFGAYFGIHSRGKYFI